MIYTSEYVHFQNNNTIPKTKSCNSRKYVIFSILLPCLVMRIIENKLIITECMKRVFRHKPVSTMKEPCGTFIRLLHVETLV